VKVLARFGRRSRRDQQPAGIHAVGTFAFFSSEPGPLISVAEGIAVAGNVKLAARVYDAMAAVAHRLGTAGRSGFFCVGPGEKALALFAGTLGRLDDAIDLLEKAVTPQRAARLSCLHRRRAVLAGALLAMSGRHGDAERARTCLDEADR
jgi:hypothetical protein